MMMLNSFFLSFSIVPWSVWEFVRIFIKIPKNILKFRYAKPVQKIHVVLAKMLGL